VSGTVEEGAARLRNSIRQRRTQAKLTQQELADRVSVSRQALNRIETGHVVPGTDLTLRLARCLGCRVEELFSLEERDGELQAELQAEPGAGERLLLAQVGGRWVAHRLRQGDPQALVTAADGLLVRPERREKAEPRGPQRIRAVPLRAAEGLRGNLLVSGCDPALALLGARFAERHPGHRLSWLQAGSDAALGDLYRGQVHLAGAHLFDEEAREYNVPFVRRSFAGRPMLVATFAHIEEGFAVAPGNPGRIRRPEDLARRGVRLVNREAGTGARRLLDRLLSAARVPASAVAGYDRLARGHLEVAALVAAGGADVGVVARSAALAHGLDFVPLAEERFDLVLPKEWSGDPRVVRLFDTLESRGFRRELAAVGGYDARRSGQLVAELRE
jgi:molybdate-binding protein/DNA-binding XRE family transcriptional regulator